MQQAKVTCKAESHCGRQLLYRKAKRRETKGTIFTNTRFSLWAFSNFLKTSSIDKEEKKHVN
eukprot:3785978-Amphidinium_carterae.1